MLSHMVIFGATGDLAARLLVPGLAELRAAGDIDGGLTIMGAGIEDMSDEAFRAHMRAALAEHASTVDEDARAAIVAAMSYRQTDLTHPGSVEAAIANDGDPMVVYLALPPALFAPTLRALADAGLPAGSVIAIEKPFGQDLASARALNRLLVTRLPHVTVFRNDHFLHKQTVQNVLGLRFGNRLLEPVWNAENVEGVEIAWDETLALEGRASYYDRSGALKDMLQNHLLQILCFSAMEPPASLHDRDLRAAKLAVLRAVPTPDHELLVRHTVRGRYTAGTIDGRAVPSYVDEPGVDPQRHTETYAQVTLGIENWRWAGVPFTLRSGKALRDTRAEVVVRFREVPHRTFATQPGCMPNELRLRLHPPAASLGININAEGELMNLTRTQLSADLPAPRFSAYAGLLHDVLAGDVTLSVGGEEAEEAWRIMQPIVDGWASDATPLRSYPAGSTVPDQWNTVGARTATAPPA